MILFVELCQGDNVGTSGGGMRRDQDGMKRAKEQRREDTVSSVADLAKEGAAKAMENGIEMGEKAKQTVDAAWDGFKETTNNVKDTISAVADSDYEPTSTMKNQTTSNTTDPNVESLRKRGAGGCGGYEL